jgi:uncharacterized protein DUF5671
VSAPSRGAAYRRFYLYSALSVGVIAVAVAAALLLHIALQALGFGQRQSANDVSRSVSLAIALLAVAVPVGGAHLWLILRSLADPAEGANGVRHQYLNLWVAFALLVVLFAGQSGFAAVSQDGGDATIQASVLAVAAVVAMIAAGWISRTPPATHQPRIRAAIVVMLVAMAVAAVEVASAASGAGGMFQSARVPPIPVDGSFRPIVTFSVQRFQEQQFRSGLFTAGLALTVWAFGFAWQSSWPDSRDRLGCALLGYGAGTLGLLVGASFGVAAAIRLAQDPIQIIPFTTTWPSIAAGALLVAANGTLLLTDRGRNGHPAVTTTRLLLAFPALVGLGSIVGALGLAWHAFLERDVLPAQHIADDLTQGAALLIVGALAYLPSWLAFRRRATAESAVRRFYLFTVVCLALVAGLVSGVIVVYNAITVVAGVAEFGAGRTALTWAVPAVMLTAIFTAHLTVLLRDQRQTRVTEAGPVDPLLALLEDVRAGRVSIDRAAATIRGPLS